MNERTLELAKQAGLKKDHASDREYMGDFDWREYGELIVKECLTQVFYYEEDEHRISESIHERIKEHFGVKE
jgi:hypothetical protein